MAEVAGVTTVTIWRWKKNIHRIPAEALKKIEELANKKGTVA
jgi:hypothetical protein